MKIGIHSMVWVGEWNDDGAREAIARTAETGYDLIELTAISPSTMNIPLTAKLLEENGLGCSASLGWGPAPTSPPRTPTRSRPVATFCSRPSTSCATAAARCSAASSTRR